MIRRVGLSRDRIDDIPPSLRALVQSVIACFALVAAFGAACGLSEGLPRGSNERVEQTVGSLSRNSSEPVVLIDESGIGDATLGPIKLTPRHVVEFDLTARGSGGSFEAKLIPRFESSFVDGEFGVGRSHRGEYAATRRFSVHEDFLPGGDYDVAIEAYGPWEIKVTMLEQVAVWQSTNGETVTLEDGESLVELSGKGGQKTGPIRLYEGSFLESEVTGNAGMSLRLIKIDCGTRGCPDDWYLLTSNSPSFEDFGRDDYVHSTWWKVSGQDGIAPGLYLFEPSINDGAWSIELRLTKPNHSSVP